MFNLTAALQHSCLSAGPSGQNALRFLANPCSFVYAVNTLEEPTVTLAAHRKLNVPT